MSINARTTALIVVLICAVLLPALVSRAQDKPPRPDDPSPATGHAQVIAHGVAPLPAGEIVWRVRVAQAIAPHRTETGSLPTGFLLADDGVVAVIDAHGAPLARVAPGEAVWLPPPTSGAVITLERRSSAYYELALVPATELADDDRATPVGAPFAAAAGDAFDVDLIRDTLERAEESVIAAGPMPALLLVTAGTVFVASADGSVVELTTGRSIPLAGETVVSGASRAASTFVVARIGPPLPARITGREPRPGATPISASPVAADASVAITAFFCPDGYGGDDFAADCPTPADNVLFAIEAGGPDLVADITNARGKATLSPIPPNDYLLVTDLGDHPGDAVSPYVACRDRAGASFAVELSAARNLAAISLAAGDDLACDWYIVPHAGDSATAVLDGDGDGLRDADETGFYGTDPANPDTDGDGLADAAELVAHGTNPLLADTDGDDAPDAEEIAAGADPRDEASLPATSTPPPSPAAVSTSPPEAAATPAASPGTAPAVDELTRATGTPAAGEGDLDGDGLTTADELAIHGTDPAHPDSDGDGFSDGGEVAAGTDPADSPSHR
jgi:hypothetical protein